MPQPISLNGLQGRIESTSHPGPLGAHCQCQVLPLPRPNLFLNHKHRFYKAKNTVEQNSWVSFTDLMQLTLINPVTRYSSEVLAVETWHIVNIVTISWHTEKKHLHFYSQKRCKTSQTDRSLVLYCTECISLEWSIVHMRLRLGQSDRGKSEPDPFSLTLLKPPIPESISISE